MSGTNSTPFQSHSHSHPHATQHQQAHYDTAHAMSSNVGGSGGGAYPSTPSKVFSIPSSTEMASVNSFVPTSSSTLASAAVQRHATPQKTFNATTSSTFSSSSSHSRPLVSFQYSTRLGLALLPALLILLVAGGRPLLIVMSITAILAYLLDQFGTPEGSFVMVWLGVIGSMVSLSLENGLKSYTMFSTVLLILFNCIIIMMGLYITCHYSFLSNELFLRTPLLGGTGNIIGNGQIERLLFGALYMPLVTIEMMALFAVGAEAAPWLMCAVCVWNYVILVRPLPSSEQVSHILIEHEKTVQLKKEAAAKSSGVNKLLGHHHLRSSSIRQQQQQLLASIPLGERDLVISPLMSTLYSVLFICLPYWLYLSLHHNYLMAHLLSAEGGMLVVIQILAQTLITKDGEKKKENKLERATSIRTERDHDAIIVDFETDDFCHSFLVFLAFQSSSGSSGSMVRRLRT